MTSRLLVETAIETGLRWGELSELRPSDLDLHTRMLTVSRAVSELTIKTTGARLGLLQGWVTSSPDRAADPFVVKDYPKDREYRRLKVSAAVCESLGEHIAERGLDRSDLLFPFRFVAADRVYLHQVLKPAPVPEDQPDERTEPNGAGRTYAHGTLTAYTLGRCRCSTCRAGFAAYRAQRRAAGMDDPRGAPPTVSESHVSRRWFRRSVWMPAIAAAQLPVSVRFHDLRQAHASGLLAGGADIQIVKERLGHGSLRTTEKYLHTLPDADDTALEALERTRSRAR